MLQTTSPRRSGMFSFLGLLAMFAAVCAPLAWSADTPERPRYVRLSIPLPPDLQALAQTRPQVAPRAGGLVINATFDDTINNDARAADIKATINQAIAFYQSTFTDSVTVSITFVKMNSGLGQSETYNADFNYSDYRTALAAKTPSADDTTALAHLPTGANEPVSNGTQIHMTTALGRVMGFKSDPPQGQPDSTISLNTGLCNILSTDADPNKYSLFSTVCHEMDEVLGLGSQLDTKPPTPVAPEDLFRYDGNGNRSFTADTGATSWFSIDGTTNIVRFNQDPSGDRGDWYSPGGQTPRVQDAFGSPGEASLQPADELRALDVIGWTRASSGGAINLTQDTSVAFTVPAAAVTTTTINLSAAVKNTGTAAAGAFVVRFTFSTDMTPSADDVLIGDVNVAGVAGGASAPVSFSGTCPIVKSQSYFVIMTIDPKNNIAETNKGDNVAVSASTVAVTGVQPPVIASAATAMPNPANTGDTVTFTVAATDPNAAALSYSWDFGDGTTDTSGASVTHVYTQTGTFQVVVTVSDTPGGKATSSVSMQVNAPFIAAAAVKKSFQLNFKTESDKIDVTLTHADFSNIVDNDSLTFWIGDIASKGANFDTAIVFKNKGAGNLGKFTVNTRKATVRYAASKVQLQTLLSPLGATATSAGGTVSVPLFIQVNKNFYGGTFDFNYSVRGTTGTGK